MLPKLLVVSNVEKRARLLPLLESEEFNIDMAIGFQDGIRKLSTSHSYDLLIVDAELPDGSWKNLLLFVQNSEMDCEMIILARHGDPQLWAEVIQCGAYDLISEPVEQKEVAHIVRSALEGRYMRRFIRPAAVTLAEA